MCKSLALYDFFKCIFVQCAAKPSNAFNEWKPDLQDRIISRESQNDELIYGVWALLPHDFHSAHHPFKLEDHLDENDLVLLW